MARSLPRLLTPPGSGTSLGFPAAVNLGNRGVPKLLAGRMGSANVYAFLGMIGWSELGPAVLAASDGGFNVLVGSTPAHVYTFPSYADHPRILMPIRNKTGDIILRSTAAGKFQILERYFDIYKKQLALPDFGHAAQEAIAVQMIRECGALSDIESGKVSSAIAKCSSRWASFPGGGYGQPTHPLPALLDVFKQQGGTLVS